MARVDDTVCGLPLCLAARSQPDQLPHALCMQLKPSATEEEPAEWLQRVWQGDVHTPTVSTFLMSMKVSACCMQLPRQPHGALMARQLQQ